MTDTLPPRQAVIGVGTMGSLMASALLDAGVDLAVHDLRRAAAEPLLQRGARWCNTPADVARDCPVVWASLPGPEQVLSALLDTETGALAGMSPGAVLIDTTTDDPDVARRVAAACLERDCAMLDAPVSGRPPTMTLMAGGRRAVFDRMRPTLETVAAQVFYVGEAGAGCAAKLATQYMGYTNLIAAIEGMLIGKAAGIDPSVLAEIVPVSAGASRAFNAIPNAILDGSYQAGGTLDIVAKDVALACALAQRLHAPAATGEQANALYKAAQELGWGSAGYPVIARLLEELAGQKLTTDSTDDAAGAD